MVCGGRYDSHAWRTVEGRRACESCGLLDLGYARLVRSVLDALKRAGLLLFGL